jgi:hypothetical protein
MLGALTHAWHVRCRNLLPRYRFRPSSRVSSSLAALPSKSKNAFVDETVFAALRMLLGRCSILAVNHNCLYHHGRLLQTRPGVYCASATLITLKPLPLRADLLVGHTSRAAYGQLRNEDGDTVDWCASIAHKQTGNHMPPTDAI